MALDITAVDYPAVVDLAETFLIRTEVQNVGNIISMCQVRIVDQDTGVLVAESGFTPIGVSLSKIFDLNVTAPSKQPWRLRSEASPAPPPTPPDDTEPYDIGVITPEEIEAFHSVGDVNRDGEIDVWDLGRIGMSFGKFSWQPGYDPDADVNQDGVCDGRDLGLLTWHWGETIEKWKLVRLGGLTEGPAEKLVISEVEAELKTRGVSEEKMPEIVAELRRAKRPIVKLPPELEIKAAKAKATRGHSPELSFSPLYNFISDMLPALPPAPPIPNFLLAVITPPQPPTRIAVKNISAKGEILA